MYRCPVPDCDHICEMFTHNHAKQHDFTDKQALFERYGVPIPLQVDGQAVKKNLKLYIFPTTPNRQYHADRISKAERKHRRDNHETVV